MTWSERELTQRGRMTSADLGRCTPRVKSDLPNDMTELRRGSLAQADRFSESISDSRSTGDRPSLSSTEQAGDG
eukprot:CAMPEP_0173241688 /NCGR_PEP_ID=MMETSP1142-20121109/14515_1 /TAXON_ID=483371 /ORGANISM="non described non described, Strain CCMP2298" /LENGTH=73 /DNA_ID=CAMNT_0014173057 /DNA_START=67 /DNA_END=288 /DNA_ORIENTATION=-